MILIIGLWIVAGWMTFGALASIAQVDKARNPLTAGTAVGVVIVTGLIVALLVSSAVALAG